jgi:uncharacterized protein (TIGR00251 family)
MLELVEIAGGTKLRLRVKAGGKQNAILTVHDGALKVSVTAAPEKGKANKAILALLADRLGIPATSLEILSGHTSPHKTVRVPLSPAEITSRLASVLGLWP